MPRLNNAQRNNVIGRLEAGTSRSEVARFFHVSPSTISRLGTRYQQQETTRDLPRSGRPRATTTAQDRYIRLRHLRQRMTTATSTASTIPGLGTISDQTVRNRLRDAGLRPRRPPSCLSIFPETTSYAVDTIGVVPGDDALLKRFV
ncbi:Uncharacterised protein r2_g2235 [Pycnogonum litorale]